MLFNRVFDTLFENLAASNIPYTMLEWSDTNETIVFIEKDGHIHTTLYDKSTKSFSSPYLLTSGASVSPSRTGDYVVIEFTFNEKVQELSVLYTDIVIGVRSVPLDLWDGLLPWEFDVFDTTISNFSYGLGGGIHQSDTSDIGGGLFVQDSSNYPSMRLPENVVIQGIELTWTHAPSDSVFNYGTSYRLYEGGVLLGETDTNVITYVPKPDTDYNITTVYRHKYPPHDEVETYGTVKNSGYQAAGVDRNPLGPITSMNTSPDSLSFHGVRPIYTPFNYEYSTFSPLSVPQVVINNNDNINNSGFKDFGLSSVDTRIEIIPVFVDQFSLEVERSIFDMSVGDMDIDIDITTLTYVDFWGNFIQ